MTTNPTPSDGDEAMQIASGQQVTGGQCRWWRAAERAGLALVAASLLGTLSVARGQEGQPDEAGAAAPEAAKSELDILATRILAGSQDVKDADVVNMLTIAKKEGKPFKASQAVKSYFRGDVKPSEELLRLAAEVAEMAGDLRLAASRYKSYLALASGDAAGSEAAARMYNLMINLLFAHEEAYNFWVTDGDKFRTTVNARKYDHFFVGKAIQMQHYDTAAAFLAKALPAAPAIEQAAYHADIQTMADEMLRLQRDWDPKLKAADKLLELSRLLPEDWRRQYVNVAGLYLKYRAELQFAKTKRPEAEIFKPVLDRAIAWYDKDPRVVVANRVFLVFATPDRDNGQWNIGAEQKRKFFQHVWDKSDDAVREWLLNRSQNRAFDVNWALGDYWRTDLLKNQWLMGRYNPQEAGGYLSGKSLEQLKEIAAQAKGWWIGVMANGLVADPEPLKALDALMAEHGPYNDTQWWQWVLFESRWFENHQQAWKRQDDRYQLSRHYFLTYFAPTSAPITDRLRARDLMETFWGQNKTFNFDELAVGLRALNWVPYSREERDDTFVRMFTEFQTWKVECPKTLAQLKTNPKPNEEQQRQLAAYEQAVANLPKVEELFKEVRDEKIYEKTTPPDEVTKRCQAYLLAQRGGKKDAIVAAAKALYDTVKGRPKQPFRNLLLAWAASYRDWDLRVAMLQEQLKVMNDTGDASTVSGVLAGIQDRDGRPWPNWINGQEQGPAKTINELLSKAFVADLAKGRYQWQVFDWIRATRKGEGWEQAEWGTEAMAKVIEGKWLAKVGHRTVVGEAPYAVNYMKMLREEFGRAPALGNKYPNASYFDDLFLEESQRLGFLCPSYCAWGGDGEGKIAKYVVEMYRKGQDPFLDGHGEWYGRLLAGGGRQAFIEYHQKEYAEQRRISNIALGWEEIEVGDLSNPGLKAQRPIYFANIKKYIANCDKHTGIFGAPSFMPLEKVDPNSLTNAELDVLLSVFEHHLGFSGWVNYTPIAWALHEGLLAKGRDKDIFRVIPYVWRCLRDNPHADWRDRGYARINTQILALLEKRKFELAAAYSLASKDIGGQLTDNLRVTVDKVRAQAVNYGLIPVGPGDPRYKLFVAQLHYTAGNVTGAWQMYQDYRAANAALPPNYAKDFDLPFLTWLIGKHTDSGASGIKEADAMGRTLIQWVDAQAALHDVEERGKLHIAFANISFVQQEFAVARAKFEAIRMNPDFKTARAPVEAELRIAEVDRLTKAYDQAIERLEKLARRADPEIRLGALYQLALVKMDQELYDEAFTFINQVLEIKPDLTDAKILQGRLHILVKEYPKATDITLGQNMAQRVIVPGRSLRVTLKDPNLVFVVRSANVQIRAWTEPGGDEEVFSLYPFGDSKTDFDGRIETELGVPKKRDGKIQLLGNDKLFYDFTAEFKKKNNIPERENMWLNVRSDAALEAASTKVLSPEEKKEAALRSMVKVAPTEGAEAGSEAERQRQMVIENRRDPRAIRPGNPIYIMVLDPAESATAKPDQVSVTLQTTSGDMIRSHLIQETDGASGIFKGVVKTDKAPPVGYASDTLEGTDPNNVLAKKDYPMGWKGRATDDKPRWFSVDMNDNVPLKDMRVIADDKEAKLKSFLIQTSLDNRTFINVGGWPLNLKAWDGKLQLEVARFVGKRESRAGKENDGLFDPSADLKDYLNWMFLVHGVAKHVVPQQEFSVAIEPASFSTGNLAPVGLTGDGPYVARLRGGFYVASRQTRIFTIKQAGTGTPDALGAMSGNYLFIDGVDVLAAAKKKAGSRGTITNQAGEPQFKLTLDKGVHLAELIVIGQAAVPFQYDLLINTSEAPYVGKMPADLFDQTRHPELTEHDDFRRAMATVTPTADNTTFNIAFPEELNARTFRLVFLEFEGNAPAVRKIALNNREGKAVLPLPQDFHTLRENDILEVIAGDEITVRFTNRKPIDETNMAGEIHEGRLNVTYQDARVEAAFVTYEKQGDEMVPKSIPLVRFKSEEPIKVTVVDSDVDTTPEVDKLKFMARVTGQQPIEIEATESAPSSGVFEARIFPMKEPEKDKPTHLKILPDDTITLKYLDRENTNPGIPWERSVKLNQVYWQDPEMRLYNVKTVDLDPSMYAVYQQTVKARRAKARAEADAKAKAQAAAAAKAQAAGKDKEKDKDKDKDKDDMSATAVAMSAGTATTEEEDDTADEKLLALVLSRPEKAQPSDMGSGYIACPVVAEVIWPTAVLSPASTLAIYAQTSTGRKKSGKEFRDDEFDPAVPGTIKVGGGPSFGFAYPVPESCATVVQPLTEQVALDPLDDGVFTFGINTRLGTCPDDSPATAVALPPAPGAAPAGPAKELTDSERAAGDPGALAVTGDDIIYVGFQYKDWNEKEFWMVQRARLISVPTFYVRDIRYERSVKRMYVGETFYLSVVDKLRDITPDRDVVEVEITTKSGRSLKVELRETFEHTGEFRGSVEPVYVAEGAEVPAGKLGVVYGDNLTATYAVEGLKISHEIAVNKGADGSLLAFTKRFQDKEIAVQTQFTIAEAFFELAKKHRALNKQDVARHEIMQGKRLLEEAIRDFPDSETRAQADYLLAELALEFADDAVDSAVKTNYYLEAVNKFGDIVASNAKSPYAPKAQFKKALTFERMNRLDKACDEYVKLSYKYPNNELVAETIARLGQYFWRKGNAFKKVADNPDNDAVEALKAKMRAENMFRTSAEVFSRMAKRFPAHKLAGKTTVLGGQAYIKAGLPEKAIDVLSAAIKAYAEDKTVCPEAMYWLGDCYLKTKDFRKAYRTWKTLTWDYPDTLWAKYARGQLAQNPAMLKADQADEDGK